jgi:dihydroorotase
MNSLLLTGGRVIDPGNRLDMVADVLIVDGKVSEVAAGIASRRPTDLERFDANGLIVCPGLIDIHVHLREPGQRAKETIATGTAAARWITSAGLYATTSPKSTIPGQSR